jgi:hypothetical protein
VPKETEIGDKVTGNTAAPLRFMMLELPVNVREPKIVPAAVGLNVTPTVQVAPAASVAPQGFDPIVVVA